MKNTIEDPWEWPYDDLGPFPEFYERMKEVGPEEFAQIVYMSVGTHAPIPGTRFIQHLQRKIQGTPEAYVEGNKVLSNITKNITLVIRDLFTPTDSLPINGIDAQNFSYNAAGHRMIADANCIADCEKVLRKVILSDRYKTAETVVPFQAAFSMLIQHGFVTEEDYEHIVQFPDVAGYTIDHWIKIDKKENAFERCLEILKNENLSDATIRDIVQIWAQHWNEPSNENRITLLSNFREKLVGQSGASFAIAMNICDEIIAHYKKLESKRLEI